MSLPLSYEAVRNSDFSAGLFFLDALRECLPYREVAGSTRAVVRPAPGTGDVHNAGTVTITEFLVGRTSVPPGGSICALGRGCLVPA